MCRLSGSFLIKPVEQRAIGKLRVWHTLLSSESFNTTYHQKRFTSMTKIERRTFLKQAATISAFTILSPRIVFGTQANSAVRVGIIGCGSRGTAVISSMSQHTNTNIIAMADLFKDQLQTANKTFDQLNAARGCINDSFLVKS